MNDTNFHQYFLDVFATFNATHLKLLKISSNDCCLFSGPRVHVLKCSTAGKPLWETVVMSPGIALAGNRWVSASVREWMSERVRMNECLREWVQNVLKSERTPNRFKPSRVTFHRKRDLKPQRWLLHLLKMLKSLFNLFLYQSCYFELFLAYFRQVICVACENRSIDLFSSTGRK